MPATNAGRAGKRGNICVGNNVSTTMCPCLPGPINGKGDLNFSCMARLHVLIFCSVLQFSTIALQQLLIHAQISQR